MHFFSKQNRELDPKLTVPFFLNLYIHNVITVRRQEKQANGRHTLICLLHNHVNTTYNLNTNLVKLLFQNVIFNFNSMDFQPSPVNTGILIFVTGAMKLDADSQFEFSQVFQLLPNSSGGFYIHNDILRLNLD